MEKEIQTGPDHFCSQLSRDLGEPMFGTALHREIWFLLEYDGPWQARATADNDLPKRVQEWMDSQEEAAAGMGRFQFIKQPDKERDGVTLFVATVDDAKPRLFRFRLPGYQALPELDAAGLVAGTRDDSTQNEYAGPLFLVCTNGLRDRCCALHGVATYNALAEVAGPDVWQTTHLGGHRFAANVVTFPDATYYGRLAPEDAPEFVATRRRGEIYLSRLRGRTCYEPVVQAADYFLRQATGQLALGAFRHLSALEQDEDAWEVRFSADGGANHLISLRRELSSLPLYASCGKLQSKPVWQYELLSHEVV